VYRTVAHRVVQHTARFSCRETSSRARFSVRNARRPK
jgi:hypothetical protein